MFILEFSTMVQGNPGHDKAPSHSVYISSSTMGISVEENPTAVVAKSLEKNSRRTSGFTEGLIIQP